jgi:glutamyl-tRNA synthetase
MSKAIIQQSVRKYALQNAVQYNGKANEKAVIGKVIAELKKQGILPKDIIPVVNFEVKKINKLSINDQISELKKIDPNLITKEKKDRDFSLSELPNAEMGKVITRFPPEPNGYLHIGHAKAVIVDYEYARMYDGKFILRFDDTNPENAKKEFYDAQKDDLIWLGIEWDEEYNTSSNLLKHYELATKLIKQGDAYVCSCSTEDIKNGRFLGKECKCRVDTIHKNLQQWNDMINSSIEGKILRLRGDMTCANTAMRDPSLFRIIDKPHPLHGNKYRVWPTYDFAGAVEDSLSGVTHPFRTKEYELRDECYFKLLDLLDLRKPTLMEFSRLSIQGMPVSKRKIKPLIEKGFVTGYDDIRLPTLRGLKKRGILPDAIKQFIFSQGISKTESSVDFSILESFNRKILDPITKRYFFVDNPIKLIVKGAPKLKKEIKLHPSKINIGTRTIDTNDVFFVSNNDISNYNVGDVFRLKDLFNVKLIEKKDTIIGEFYGDELIMDSPKIQWTTNNFIKMHILVPYLLFLNEEFNQKSLIKIDGYSEEAVSNVKSGEIIQFERFGFVRIEKDENNIVGYFTHK